MATSFPSFKGYRTLVAENLFLSKYKMQDFCFLSLDMNQCHIRIVEAMLGESAPVLSGMIDKEEMWTDVIQSILLF